MPERLILFDVDGTLLTTNGQALAAMRAAHGQVYGVSVAFDGLPTDGRTELWLAHALLARAGLSRAQVDAGLPDFWRAYRDELARTLRPERITVFPGVRELLERLRGRPEVLLGLLTGNIEPIARLKLEAAGLDGFRCGAYGGHHERREALPGLALEAAERLCGARFPGRAVTIVGDTPHDVTCGRHLEVNAVAVATGKFGLRELAACGPHHLFADLSDTAAVLRALGCGRDAPPAPAGSDAG